MSRTEMMMINNEARRKKGCFKKGLYYDFKTPVIYFYLTQPKIFKTHEQKNNTHFISQSA